MAPDTEKLNSQLSKILESDQFSRSNANKVLLKLLFYATIEGRKLKEATIGTEIFGKKYDPVKNDNKVRVYIHNLRKKLSAYYEEEGRLDEVIFEIEKGDYRVSFKNRTVGKSKFSIGIVFFILLLLIVGGGIIASVLIENESKFDFWDGFSSNDFPTTLIIGDHFTIGSNVPTGGTGVFRDFSINSEQDFSQYIHEHPEQASAMIPNSYPYITKMGPYSTKALSMFFVDHGISFDLALNSEWEKSKITSENIVYVGQFKTLRFLRNVFAEYFSNYEFGDNHIIRKDSLTGQIQRFQSILEDQTVDYTVVTKIHGSVGNEIAMFMSGNDIGVIQTVEYFTKKDSLSAFYDRYQLIGKDFVALFKVSGWERTGYSMELVMIDKK
ncbi:hypothetical protein ACUNWD_15790 [Sunxiuqinia sp. A32]|uniref:hypothetical protein n=1 Tax=Sunxiuqinia sp. A32 TaxID=3461496 RepID=UPI00404635A0